jgi:hypothetical protein
MVIENTAFNGNRMTKYGYPRWKASGINEKAGHSLSSL